LKAGSRKLRRGRSVARRKMVSGIGFLMATVLRQSQPGS
jgi:hypothetical protein